MFRILSALSCCVVLIHQVLGVVEIMTPGATGREVVEAVCSKIESVCIFPDAKLMLRRIALVETNDGQNAGSYAAAYYGGIWKVNKKAFLATKNLNQIIYEKIKSEFSIDWNQVNWKDLKKPFYSGLAARLYLHSLSVNLPRGVSEQATLWASKYHIEGRASDYKNTVTSYRKTCKRVADVVFVVDGSSSIEPANFKKVKTFLKQVIKFLNIGSDTKLNTRVSVVQFSGITRLEFDFNNFTTLAEYEKAIDDIIYIKRGTQTDVALDYLAEKSFLPTAGARGGDIPKIAIVLTDGASVDTLKTEASAKKVHRNKITTFVIGVGNSLKQIELEAIASDPDCKHLFRLERFDELESLVEAIEKKTCEASITPVIPTTVSKSKTTTTTIPKTKLTTPKSKASTFTTPTSTKTPLNISGNHTITLPKNGTIDCEVVVSQDRNVIEISGQGESTIYFSNITFPTSSFYDSKYEITYFTPAVVTFYEYNNKTAQRVYCRIVTKPCKEARVTFETKGNYTDPCQPDPCPCGHKCIRQLNGQFLCAEEEPSALAGYHNPCMPIRAARLLPSDFQFYPQIRRC